MGVKIGELLSARANLSQHDIEEILHEQLAARRPFGQIAVELGLCGSEDVWNAWGLQLNESTPQIDLDRVGVDSQALGAFSVELALRYRALPIREIEGALIVATTAADLPRAKDELPAIVQREMRFVVVALEQIAHEIERYYVPLTVSA